MLKDSHSTTSTSHQELGQGVAISEVAHIAEGGRGNGWSILEATDEASGSNHMLVSTVIHTTVTTGSNKNSGNIPRPKPESY